MDSCLSVRLYVHTSVASFSQNLFNDMQKQKKVIEVDFPEKLLFVLKSEKRAQKGSKMFF